MRGFTLLEVLAALAITGFVLSAIASVFASTILGIRTVDDRVALVETARRLLAELPGRDRLRPGTSSGVSGDFAWRLVVAATAGAAAPRQPQQSRQWIPLAVELTVASPVGRRIRLNSVRLAPSVAR